MHPLVVQLDSACRMLPLTKCAVLVGVSGGADSVALLHGLLELRNRRQLSIHAAHLNHKLRGAASDADAAWVGELCQRLGISCVIDQADVAASASLNGQGIEEAAREARYAFLQQAAAAQGCTRIAVAHTANDQAETILHHILRGTGLAGLSGVPATRTLESGTLLVRPLLAVSREIVLEYLSALGQAFHEDETNGDEAFTRNRLRRSLLPLLERDYNPAVRESLCRLGEQAAATQATIEACAADRLERSIESILPHECRLKWQPLAHEPRHLLRELFAELWRRQGWPRQAMTFDHWDRLAEIVVDGGRADFPGSLHAHRNGRLVVVGVRQGHHDT